MNPTPIRRSEHILKLSREHHFGLLFCWKIRQGIKNGIASERMIAYVDYFWKNDLRQHFKDEEDIVFIEMNNSLTVRALEEHINIKSMIETIHSLGEVEKKATLAQIANSVEAHIRLEERELFLLLKEILRKK